jgi:hypothetical protein
MSNRTLPVRAPSPPRRVNMQRMVATRGVHWNKEIYMIKLHRPLWELLMYGAALYLIVLFRISGQLLKNRLGRRIGARGSTATPVVTAPE